jgi:hypothetical protein
VAETCKHEGCTCETDRADGFCSDYCAGHAGEHDAAAGECACGHSDCEHVATAG